MTKRFIYIEKITAILQIIIAGFMMYSLYCSIMDQEGFIEGEHEFIGEHTQTQFHWQFVQNQEVYLLICLCFSGGILWLFNKKSGWVVSFCFWASCLVFNLVYTLPKVFDRTLNIWNLVIQTIICLPFVSILNTKPILKKYTIIWKDWTIVFGFTLLISIYLYRNRLF